MYPSTPFAVQSEWGGGCDCPAFIEWYPKDGSFSMSSLSPLSTLCLFTGASFLGLAWGL